MFRRLNEACEEAFPMLLSRCEGRAAQCASRTAHPDVEFQYSTQDYLDLSWSVISASPVVISMSPALPILLYVRHRGLDISYPVDRADLESIIDQVLQSGTENDEPDGRAANLVYIGIDFLALHELGHVGLGHALDRSESNVRAQEFEADRYAISKILEDKCLYRGQLRSALIAVFAVCPDQSRQYPSNDDRLALTNQLIDAAGSAG
jgi:hypothetical protein